MDSTAWIVASLVLLAVAIMWVAASQSRDHVRLARELENEKKWRRDEYDRLADRLWEVSGEMRTGFEALGLERQPGQPQTSASWVKRTEHTQQ